MWMCAGLLQIEDDRGSNIRLKLTGVNSHLLKILSQSLKRQSHLYIPNLLKHQVWIRSFSSSGTQFSTHAVRLVHMKVKREGHVE